MGRERTHIPVPTKASPLKPKQPPPSLPSPQSSSSPFFKGTEVGSTSIERGGEVIKKSKSQEESTLKSRRSPPRQSPNTSTTPSKSSKIPISPTKARIPPSTQGPVASSSSSSSFSSSSPSIHKAHQRLQSYKDQAAVLKNRYAVNSNVSSSMIAVESSLESPRKRTIETNSRLSLKSRDTSPSPIAKLKSQSHFFQGSSQEEEAEDEDEKEEEMQAVVDMAIRVVVRKRPINKIELSRGDKDCLEIKRQGSCWNYFS